MDWLRHPVCLEGPASQKQIDEMTDWFAAVRALTKARRPFYPLGIRSSPNLPYLRSIGLDVKELARRGLIDFCTFSNFWQTSWEMPLDELRRELGPEVTIYGGMEDAPNWLETHAPTLTERPSGPKPRPPMSTTWQVLAITPTARPPWKNGVTTVMSCRWPEVSHGSLVM